MIRLSKLMSEKGLCSRREADDLIERGLVKVNGQIIKELGSKVSPDAKVELLSEAKKEMSQLVTVILNKPIGYVSSQPEDNYSPAIQLLTLNNRYGLGPPHANPQKLKGLAVAGRLDIDSQGLLIFTQDGKIAKQIIGPDSEIEKEYLVRVKGPIQENGLQLLNGGLSLDGKKLKPSQAEWINNDQLRIVLIEGKKRQVRRMCEAVGLKVLGLKRVRIGQIRLGNLPEGQWRYLQPHEKF